MLCNALLLASTSHFWILQYADQVMPCSGTGSNTEAGLSAGVFAQAMQCSPARFSCIALLDLVNAGAVAPAADISYDR